SSEPCRIRGLVLTPVCSEEPDLTNKWEIYNQNPFSVSVDWDLFGYDIGGNINAKAGVSYLYTPSEIEYQIMKISWRDADNNIRRQQKLWYVDDCTGQAPGLARKSSVAVDSEPVDPLVDFVKIFPNPFSDNLIIKIPFDNDDGNSARSLNIYNSLGSRVYQVDSKREWNSSQIEINTSNFPSGTYIVVLDGKNLRRKAVIIKK
ncbi:MAG: T9SS type A sorting domain-containing protein, partial [Bacteroidota bacterium]